MKSFLRLIGVGAVLLLAMAACSGAQVAVQHVKVPNLKGRAAASIDVVEIDQKAHRLYAADRTDGSIDVFDISGAPARYLKSIAMPADPSGMAVAPELGLAFAGLGDGSVAIIDTRQETLVNTIVTGGKSVDLIDYSPQTGTLYAAEGAAGSIATVDVRAQALLHTFKVGYALEQPRFNPADHMLYVTSPDAGALFRIDPVSGAIKARIAVPGCQPKGMAINPNQDQALIACASWLVRVNLRNPSDMLSYTQVGGGDVITYYPSIDRFLVAAPDAKPSEVALFGGNPIDYVTAVTTRGAGNSAAYDESNRMVYAPDVMPGREGLDAFKAPTGDLIFSISPLDVAVIAGVVVGAIALLVLVGRLADPVRKAAPARAPRSAPASTPEPSGAALAPAGATVRPGARKWTRTKTT